MLARMTLQVANRRSSALRPSPMRLFVLKPSSTLASAASASDDTTTSTRQAKPIHALPRWPTSVVTCHGDYTQEAWLEDFIGGPLYQYQSSLPRLPVPSIPETLNRFLPTALPLAKNDSERQALQDAVAKFPQQAETLQKRLEQRRADRPNTSWLQEWWNTWGYLNVRDPVMINVSYFFHFRDDSTAPTNVQRGAALLQAAAVYRHQVCSGLLTPDILGKPPKQTPLCSVAYKYMFHATRIPKLDQDEYELRDPSLHHHVVVARRGQFYSMPFVHPTTGEPLSLEALEKGLQTVLDMADQRGDANLPQLGWMTSMNRDDWAKARQELLSQGGPAMQKALETLQSGAFLLCLDDESPVSRTEIAKLLLWGGDASGGNRWFDKSVQIYVANNAKAGFMGEHSMMDGMPCVGLADAMTKMTYQKCLAAKYGSTSDDCTVTTIFDEAFRALDKSVVAPLQEKAMADYSDLVSKHSLHVQSFQGYGSDFIKQAGFSPDAFVQVAMQVATYRLWGEQAGTYEATQVRPFLHGRTETTRSVSTQSAAFVQKMGDRPKMDEHDAEARKEKLALLREAVNAHVKYIGLAAKAQGVDRHFLGLSMLVGEGEQSPDLYSDPTFIRSKRWRVSTSHLTHPNFDGWGYGEVVPDGVGLAYSIHKRHCVFNITALREHEWTDKLSNLLEESLLEMRTLVEMEQASQPTSRL